MKTEVKTQDTQNRKYRKTVRLTTDQRRALNAFAKAYDTQEDVAIALGIKVGAYARIKELGRGNSVNIDLIREKLSQVA